MRHKFAHVTIGIAAIALAGVAHGEDARQELGHGHEGDQAELDQALVVHDHPVEAEAGGVAPAAHGPPAHLSPQRLAGVVDQAQVVGLRQVGEGRPVGGRAEDIHR